MYDYQSIKTAMEKDETSIQVFSLIAKCLEIDSVIDIGCGVGKWLLAAKKNRCNKLTGIEIDEDSRKEAERVSGAEILANDLEAPLDIDQRFDICIFYEVAEHLSEKRSESIINEITKLSDIVLFSAATPYQGGNKISIHINEQWPSYWIDKFKKNNFYPLDIIRATFWNDSRVGYYKRANPFLFIKNDKFSEIEEKFEINGFFEKSIYDIVHPLEYMNMVSRCNKGIYGHLKEIAKIILKR